MCFLLRKGRLYVTMSYLYVFYLCIYIYIVAFMYFFVLVWYWRVLMLADPTLLSVVVSGYLRVIKVPLSAWPLDLNT